MKYDAAELPAPDDRFFRHIVSSMRNGVIAFRRDGTLALMNNEAYRIFGLTVAPGGGLDGPGSGPIQTGFDPDDLGPAGEMLADVASPVLVLFGGRVRRPQRRGPAAVPDVRGLFTGTCREVARRHGLEVTAVRLTERPMPVEGLVVSQEPAPGARCRGGRLTVQVWHPPFRNPS